MLGNASNQRHAEGKTTNDQSECSSTQTHWMDPPSRISGVKLPAQLTWGGGLTGGGAKGGGASACCAATVSSTLFSSAVKRANSASRSMLLLATVRCFLEAVEQQQVLQPSGPLLRAQETVGMKLFWSNQKRVYTKLYSS